MKSSIENLLSDQLQGLLLPPSQEDDAGIYLLLGFIMLCICLVAASRWKQHRNTAPRIAIKQINALKNEYQYSSESKQITAIKLAHLLRQGLRTTRLDTYLPQDMAKWKGFLKRLNFLCYAPEFANNTNNNTSQEPAQGLTQVIQESLNWLSSVETKP